MCLLFMLIVIGVWVVVGVGVVDVVFILGNDCYE